jgi:gliding motility-associated-like protein
MCDEAVVTIYVAESEIIEPPFQTTCDSLFIPNGFSPNSDNINDYFLITIICESSDGSISESDFYAEYPDAKVEIYNRWGNLVFEKEKYGNIGVWGEMSAWWDGRSTSGWTVGNEMLPAGTYFYVLNFNDGNKEPKAGSIFLNR